MTLLERNKEALGALEKVVLIRQSGGDTLALAKDRFGLAQAYWKEGFREQGLKSATGVLKDLEGKEDGESIRESAEAWLENPS